MTCTPHRNRKLSGSGCRSSEESSWDGRSWSWWCGPSLIMFVDSWESLWKCYSGIDCRVISLLDTTHGNIMLWTLWCVENIYSKLAQHSIRFHVRHFFIIYRSFEFLVVFIQLNMHLLYTESRVYKPFPDSDNFISATLLCSLLYWILDPKSSWLQKESNGLRYNSCL